MSFSTYLGSQELRNPSSYPLLHSPKSNPLNAAGCNLKESSSLFELSGMVYMLQPPTGLRAWCLTEQEKWLFRTVLEIPWHMKRKMSIYEALQQLFRNWNRNLQARIVYMKPVDKVSSAKEVPNQGTIFQKEENKSRM